MLSTTLLLMHVALPSAEPANVVFHGGPILTAVEGRTTVDAVAIENGRIVAVGTKSEILALVGPETRVVDLGGKTLAPGFIDLSSHVADLALLWGAPDLESPALKAESVARLVAVLAKHVADAKLPPGRACIAFNYDEARLAERRDLTVDELAVLDRPVFLLHANGRRALTANGVIDGPAVVTALSKLLQESRRDGFDEVQRLYASQGVTTARDRPLLALAAERLRRARYPFVIDVLVGVGPPTPIQPPGPLVTMHEAVNDSRKRDPLSALRDVAGTIAVGRSADFVVLSANPLSVERTKIKDVRVLETIKRGATIFRADGESSRPHPYYCRCCSDPNPPQRGWADALRRGTSKVGPRLPGPDGDAKPNGGRP